MASISGDPFIGQSLGKDNRYRIERLLGEGGMGAVYLAQDTRLSRPVAIKIMHRHYGRQPDFRKRFLQEAQLAAALDHPGIVHVYDYDDVGDGSLYIVMEYIRGQDLKTLLEQLSAQRRVLPLPDAVSLIAQIADALAHAHYHNIIHRDIKPANIMLKQEVTRAGAFRPMLTDLGVAKSSEGTQLTQPNTTMGSPAYMSPEQAQGLEIDHRSDLYSLGVMLYEVTVGQRPFPVRSITDAIRYHVNEQPPSPRSVRPDLPPALEQVILRAMAKSPAQRYQSARELADALTALPLQGTATSTTPSPAGTGGETTLRRGSSAWPPRDQEQPAIAPSNVDRIQAVAPNGSTRAVALRSPMTIGRAPTNDLVINDPEVSAHHARIEKSGAGYRVVDLNSRNGTYLGDVRLLAGVQETWNPSRPLWIGAHALYFVPGQHISGTESEIAAPPLPADVRVRLDRTDVQVNPGERAQVQIQFENNSAQVARYQIKLDGIPPEWATIEPEHVDLFARATGTALITLHPPRATTVRARNYPLRITLVPVGGMVGAPLSATVQLAVGSYGGFMSEMRQTESEVGEPLYVTITNESNSAIPITLTAWDQSNELQFTIPQPKFNLEPGQSVNAEFSADLPRNQWFGGKKPHAFQVRVSGAHGQNQIHSGTYVSHSMVAPWMPPLLLALLIALAAGGVWAIRSNQEREARAAANNLATATAETATAVALDANAAAQATATQAVLAAGTATAEWRGADDDRDNLTNGFEEENGLNWASVDTDNDDINDGDEIDRGTMPNRADSDGDGIKDGIELLRGTNPLLADTDSDGTPDATDSDALNVPTPTPLPTATATATPVPSATATWTNTPAPSDTPVPTDTPTPSPTVTPVPTDTPTPMDTATPTETFTPSPTLPPTDTPTPSVTPPYGGGHAPPDGPLIAAPAAMGSLAGRLYAPENFGTDTDPTFRNEFSIEAYVYDPDAGNRDGDGIDHVQFNIWSSAGDLVYEKIENDARFCSQGSGNELGSTCPTLRLEPGVRWSHDGPLVENGVYYAEVYAIPANHDREGAVWTFNFQIDANLDNGGGGGGGGGGGTDLYAEIVQTGAGHNEGMVSGALVFQVYAYDPAAGTDDGAGIDFVQHEVTYNGHTVYERREQNAHYCAFSGGEPDCDIYFFHDENGEWPEGEQIEEGNHLLRATVRGRNGHEVTIEREIYIVP